MKKLEIKNKIKKIIINKSNDNNESLIIGNNINIETRLPHVPEAIFMYPIKKIDTKILVNIFITNLNY